MTGSAEYLGDDVRVTDWKKIEKKQRQEREDAPNNGSDSEHQGFQNILEREYFASYKGQRGTSKTVVKVCSSFGGKQKKHNKCSHRQSIRQEHEQPRWLVFWR